MKKNILTFITICIITLSIAVGITYYVEGQNFERDIPKASSISELEVFVDFPIGVQSIKPWKNTDGVYVYFLPSGSENYRVYFGNINKGTQIVLGGGGTAAGQTSLLKQVPLEECIDVRFESPAGIEEAQLMFVKSNAVAVMFLETESGKMDSVHAYKEHREKASILLLNEEGEEEYSDSIEYVKARGNSTFYNAEKKSYQVKLKNQAGILDMPAADKWLLLANEVDFTLMKNELIFRFTEKYSTIPTIKGRYIDLFLNGEYAGNYYLCEKVEVQNNRLDISDLHDATKKVNYERDYTLAAPYVSEDGNIKATVGLNNPSDITGGYLLEHIVQAEFSNSTNAFRTNSGHCYEICSPKIATREQAEYICNFFNEMEAAMQDPNGINPNTGKHFSEYLDVDSWAMKYLIEEAFSDGDASAASAFFYKESDEINAHLFAGPMWDYDRALGSYGYFGSFVLDDPKGVRNLGIYVEELMQHEDVKQRVCELLESKLIPYADNLMQADVYNLRKKIEQSEKLNRIRWPKIYGYYSDYEAATNYLTIFLQERTHYLQEIWCDNVEYCTVTFLDYYGKTAFQYEVRKGECLDVNVGIPNYVDVAVFYGWQSVGDKLPYDSRLPILQDITYEPKWIETDILLANGLAILQGKTSEYGTFTDWTQIPPEALEALAQFIRENTASQGVSE